MNSNNVLSLSTHETVSTKRAFSNMMEGFGVQAYLQATVGQRWLVVMILSPDSVLRLALRFPYNC